VRLGARVASVAVLWVGAFGALRLSFLAPEDCPARSPEELIAGAAAAGDWIARAQGDDGRYVYEYDREEDAVGPGYNIVRHAGVTMSLYQLARAGQAEALAPADRGLEAMLDALVPAGAGEAFGDGGSQVRLGASSLMAAGLAQRRAATGDDRYDDVLRALGRFLVGQLTESGQMLDAFDLETGAPVPGRTSRYATGEAAWALAQMHNLFPGEGWDVPARRILDYLATERDEVEGLDYAPWPDQWASYTLGELAPSGLSAEHVAYARVLAERFGMLVRTESQKDGWPLPVIDPRARAAGLGVWGEGIGALAVAAAHDDRLADLREPLAARLACTGSLLLERQYDAEQAAEWARPELVEGAWYRLDVTRMDDQQHALTGLLVAAGELGPVTP
jgi:hypothetical protein